MGLPPMFARPEARHQRQIASTGPAWGQRTDILIVVNGMVLTARYVALSFYSFHLEYIVSPFPPSTDTCGIWSATGHYCVVFFVSLSRSGYYLCTLWFYFLWLLSTLGVSFLADFLYRLSLLLANLRAISYEWATQAPCRHYPSSSTSASLSHLLISQSH